MVKQVIQKSLDSAIGYSVVLPCALHDAQALLVEMGPIVNSDESLHLCLAARLK